MSPTPSPTPPPVPTTTPGPIASPVPFPPPVYHVQRPRVSPLPASTATPAPPSSWKRSGDAQTPATRYGHRSSKSHPQTRVEADVNRRLGGRDADEQGQRKHQSLQQPPSSRAQAQPLRPSSNLSPPPTYSTNYQRGSTTLNRSSTHSYGHQLAQPHIQRSQSASHPRDTFLVATTHQRASLPHPEPRPSSSQQQQHSRIRDLTHSIQAHATSGNPISPVARRSSSATRPGPNSRRVPVPIISAPMPISITASPSPGYGSTSSSPITPITPRTYGVPATSRGRSRSRGGGASGRTTGAGMGTFRLPLRLSLYVDTRPAVGQPVVVGGGGGTGYETEQETEQEVARGREKESRCQKSKLREKEREGERRGTVGREPAGHHQHHYERNRDRTCECGRDHLHQHHHHDDDRGDEDVIIYPSPPPSTTSTSSFSARKWFSSGFGLKVPFTFPFGSGGKTKEKGKTPLPRYGDDVVSPSSSVYHGSSESVDPYGYETPTSPPPPAPGRSSRSKSRSRSRSNSRSRRHTHRTFHRSCYECDCEYARNRTTIAARHRPSLSYTVHPYANPNSNSRRYSTGQLTTQYMNMLLALDGIPRLHNLLASFFCWILLAGFVIFPATFKEISESDSGTTTANGTTTATSGVTGVVTPGGAASGGEAETVSSVFDPATLLHNAPLFSIGSICCAIGILGMAVLFLRWRRNYIWLVNRIFLPGLLNSLTGVTSTLVSVFAVHGGTWALTSLVTVVVTSSFATLFAALVTYYSLIKLRAVKRRHDRVVGRESTGRHGEGVLEGVRRRMGERVPEAGMV